MIFAYFQGLLWQQKEGGDHKLESLLLTRNWNKILQKLNNDIINKVLTYYYQKAAGKNYRQKYLIAVKTQPLSLPLTAKRKKCQTI